MHAGDFLPCRTPEGITDIYMLINHHHAIGHAAAMNETTTRSVETILIITKDDFCFQKASIRDKIISEPIVILEPAMIISL